MSEEIGYVRKSISIRPDQDAWVEKNHILLSSVVQEALDNMMGKFRYPKEVKQE